MEFWIRSNDLSCYKIFGGYMQDLLDRLNHAQELTTQLLEHL
jgi:hypothetical protein